MRTFRRRSKSKVELKKKRKSKQNMSEVTGSLGAALGDMDGTVENGDLVFSDKEQALTILMQEVIIRQTGSEERGIAADKAWFFEACPLAYFKKTVEDLALAYLLWASTADENVYNVSRALRRMEKLAEWSKEESEFISDQQVTKEEVEELYTAWGMVVSSSSGPSTEVEGEKEEEEEESSCDNSKPIVWVIDMCAIKLDRLKAATERESIRLYWFLVHALAFNPAIQTRGVVVLEDFGYRSTNTAVAMLPPRKVVDKIVKLTQQCSAVKIKQVHLFRLPTMIAMGMSFMFAFLSSKMKRRLKKHKHFNSVISEEIDASDVPKNVLLPAHGTGPTEDLLFGKTLIITSSSTSSCDDTCTPS